MKKCLLTIITVGFLFPLLLAGCGGGKSPTDVIDPAGSWTVLVYLNADNDLEPYGILNMNQMEQIGSSDKVKIVVQMDRSPMYNSSNGDWKGCRRYYVTKDTTDPEISVSGNINSTLLENMGDVDMGDPNTLRNFIKWGQENYPADHYCLVIWNHGSGWRSATSNAIKTIPRNISFDDTSGTSIKTIDMPYALEGSPQPIDLVAMDASLMQMLEIAYEVRDNAPLLVGSEESPPGEGYPYNLWLGKLHASPGMSARQLGQAIAKDYVDYYAEPGNEYPVTESVVDLANVGNVAKAADDLAAAILPHMSTDAAALRTARLNAQAYAFDYYRDLIDYAGLVNQMIPDPDITTAYNNLQTALASAVIYEKHTGSSVSRSHGLSIYLPAPGDYTDKYEDLSFTKDYPNWSQLIQSQE